MADSVRKTILHAALTALNASSLKPTGAAAAVMGGEIDADIPSVLLYARDEDGQRATTSRSPVDLKTLHFDAEVRVAGDTVLMCYDVLDPFTSWVECLNGLMLTGAIRECACVRTGFEIQRAGQTTKLILLATVHFTVVYQQRVGSAAQKT